MVKEQTASAKYNVLAQKHLFPAAFALAVMFIGSYFFVRTPENKCNEIFFGIWDGWHNQEYGMSAPLNHPIDEYATEYCSKL